MSDISKDSIIAQANKMAEEYVLVGTRRKRKWYKYEIKDNPYKSYKFPRKNAVIWYNAFYDKCREIGRSI